MFSNPLRQFSENLDALRGFVDEIEPVLLAKLIEEAKEHAEVLAPVFFLAAEVNPDIMGAPKGERDPAFADKVRERYGDAIHVEKGKREKQRGSQSR